MSTDYHQIIHDLGYYDQAHFIRDFKDIIGISPLKYLNGVKQLPKEELTN